MALQVFDFKLRALRDEILYFSTPLSGSYISPDRRNFLIRALGPQYTLFAQHSCRLLCEQLRAALPLELREYVYEYILESEPPEHCWDAAYLGEECHAEFMATHYRISNFTIMISFLLKSSLRPDTLVHLFDLQNVGPVKLNFKFSARLAIYSPIGTAYSRTPDKYLKKVTSILDRVATFASGTRIKICIEDITVWAFHRMDKRDNPNFKTLANTGDEDLEKFLLNMDEHFFPSFKKMRDAGVRVQITLSSSWADAGLKEDVVFSVGAWMPMMKYLQGSVKGLAHPDERILYRDDSD